MKEGEILRKSLRDRKIKVKDVSIDLGLAQTTIYQYFKSEHISKEILKRFSTKYGIDIQADYRVELYARETKEDYQKGSSKISAVDYMAGKLAEGDANKKEAYNLVLELEELLLLQDAGGEYESTALRILSDIKKRCH
jgi:AcrR family transcriptional regulator